MGHTDRRLPRSRLGYTELGTVSHIRYKVRTGN